MDLFSAFDLGPNRLPSRIVMAPMTRSRAIGNVANELMATYYAQRATAGLIITEAISVSPDGTGYPRIPGLWSDAQVAGWRPVTDAVHKEGGKIFAQLFHTGRIGHPNNIPEGGEIVAPSAIAAAGEMYTDEEGPQPHPTPRAMTDADIAAAREAFVTAASNAIAAGFDGVELHAANGYLLQQFLAPSANTRDDGYGRTIAGRNRFTLETAEAMAAAIGADRLGVRISPHNTFNDVADYPETAAQYADLAAGFRAIGLAYIHLVERVAGGRAPAETTNGIRANYLGPIILNGGFDRALAEAALSEGRGDLIAFGAPFIANPDLPRRLERGAKLAAPKPELFYAPGPEGYTDYPALSGNEVPA